MPESQASRSSSVLANLLGSVSSALESVIPHVREQDSRHCKCDKPTMVSRESSMTGLIRHYGVCIGCYVIDLTKDPSAGGISWQTSSFASAAASGVPLSSYTLQAQSILSEHNARVEEINKNFWRASAVETSMNVNTTAASPSVTDNMKEPLLKTLWNFTSGARGETPFDKFSKLVHAVLPAFMFDPLRNSAFEKVLKPIGDGRLRECIKAIVDFILAHWEDLKKTFLNKKFDIFSIPSLAKDLSTILDSCLTLGSDKAWLLWLISRLLDHLGCLGPSAIWSHNLKEESKRFTAAMQRLRSRYTMAVLGILSAAAASESSSGSGPGPGYIRLHTWDQFANGLQVTKETAVQPDDLGQIAKRALATVDTNDVQYELTTCNCEHFAHWVLTGKAHREESQAQRGAGAVGGGWGSWGGTSLAAWAFATTAPTFLGSTWLGSFVPAAMATGSVAVAAPAATVVWAAYTLGMGGHEGGKEINKQQTEASAGGQGKFDDLLRKYADRNCSASPSCVLLKEAFLACD